MYFLKAKGVLLRLAGLIVLLAVFFALGNAARTEAATFAERTETMAHIKAVRVSTDKKHTRIVMDITKDM
uniref:hypothetical protein n=1 Tax=Anaerovibrio sp. TaxID=1872532 RepID=UPI0025F8C8D3